MNHDEAVKLLGPYQDGELDLSTCLKLASSSTTRTVPAAGVPCGRASTTVVPEPGALVNCRFPPRIRASRLA